MKCSHCMIIWKRSKDISGQLIFMLVSNFTHGEMREELFMNSKEGINMMIVVSWNHGLHTLDIVELMKLI